MNRQQAIIIENLSDEITGRSEEDDLPVVHHDLVLRVRLGRGKPIRVSVLYAEAVRDGRKEPQRITWIDRSEIPIPVRPRLRRAILEHLGKRFHAAHRAWPPEPVLFKPGDVILDMHGDAWKFAPDGAMRFLRACARHRSKGIEGDRPSGFDYGGIPIEGVPVLALRYDDDWSAENLQELIRGLKNRKVHVASATNKGDLA